MDAARIISTVTVLCVVYCHGFLNIEELTDMKYALDILNMPLNAMEVNPADGLKLASRHGQDYYCKMPEAANKASDSPEDRIPKSTPIPSLLEPMRLESCLKTMKGWWTYEFCYGKYVKQYHSEDDVQKGDITYLGYFESDFDWNQETLDDSKHLKRHKLNRYHSQMYVNGTSCDVINHRRDTEIRYLCDDSSTETYIERVDEPSTCSYVITVHTPYICSHPHTRPMKSPKPVDIVCQPILSPDEYETYQKKKNEEEELATQLAKEHEEVIAAAESVKSSSEERLFGDFFNLLNLLLPQKGPKQPPQEKTEKEAPPQNPAADVSPSEAEAMKTIERFIVPERLQNLDAFKQKLLLRNVEDLIKLQAGKPTADVARFLEKYITTFVEVTEELGDRERQVKEIEQKLGESLSNELMETMHKFLPPDSEENTGDSDGGDEDSGKKKGPPSVRLKIHKLKSMEDIGKMKVEDFTSDEVEDPVELDPTWKKLEEDIGKGLEEAGFSEDANHIEIRVVTNQENIGDSIYLSDEEGQRFRMMLLELVAGGAARKNEVKKQKVLHDNYNVVWRKGVAQSLSTYEEEPEDVEAKIKSPKL